MNGAGGRPIIDGANIVYAPGRIIECHGYIGSGKDYKPLNLLEHQDEPTARDTAISLSRLAVSKILAMRNTPIGEALPLPEYTNFTAARVFDFVHKKLGMEPIGRLAYVKSIGNMAVAGLTDYQYMVALVNQRHTNTYNARGVELDEKNKIFEMLFNTLTVQGVAVHELTHLAGAQDVLYFQVDNTFGQMQVLNATSTLESQPPLITNNGKYFEEGLASLVHSMYFWFDSSPDISNMYGEIFETFKSSTGTRLYIPTRLVNPLAAHHEFAVCACGIERLVQLVPQTWDIFMASRKYGAKSENIRHTLRRCMEAAVPGMYDRMDTVNVDDIDSMIDVTARVTFEANKYQL